MNSIFEKYHRVESSVEGNGIGLYLVKQILESSGGKITAESTPDIGSNFRVFLPLNVDHI